MVSFFFLPSSSFSFLFSAENSLLATTFALLSLIACGIRLNYYREKKSGNAPTCATQRLPTCSPSLSSTFALSPISLSRLLQLPHESSKSNGQMYTSCQLTR
jgi:hypothetical protein